MLSENSIVTGRNGFSYQLGREIGNGGEGWVYTVQNNPSLAIKLYKKEIDRQEDKLKYMVAHPIPELRNAHGNYIIRIAWPIDLVYANGRFVGYVMPFIEGGVEIFEIHRCCTSPKAKKMYPNYSWVLNVEVAHNLAMAVDYLHRYHCVIGDLNCKNILVDANASIVFLDVDSFDITDQTTGAHYKCTAGTEDYLPPELQGRDLRSERARFTEHTDDFALAIHIFQLLMDNYHPFSCVRREQMKDSSNSNPRLEQIGSGSCPYVKKVEGADVPPKAPLLWEVLPEPLVLNFARTFDYSEQNCLALVSQRTPASVWASDLENLRRECGYGGLVRCKNNPRHWYLQSIGICGQCEAERRFAAHLGGQQNVPVSGGAVNHTNTNTNNKPSEGKSGIVWLILVFVILSVLIQIDVEIVFVLLFGLLGWATIIFVVWLIFGKKK